VIRCDTLNYQKILHFKSSGVSRNVTLKERKLIIFINPLLFVRRRMCHTPLNFC
jgi:hypothetical protein